MDTKKYGDWVKAYNTLSENSNLDRFTKMTDYKYGDPSSAAKRLQKALNQLRTAIDTAETEAGGTLAPAIMAALKQDISRILNP